MPLHYIKNEAPGQSIDWASRKYHGEVATGYEAKRQESPKWKAEQEIIENIISSTPRGDWVLDCPVGTGRFLSAYHTAGLLWRGVDISADMLKEARRWAGPLWDNDKIRLYQGDVRDLGFEDKSVDLSIMCRLTRWLSHEDRVVALRELQRVTRKKIVLTARVANHKHAYPIADIENALDGWGVTDNIIVGDDENYRVIVLEPNALG